MCTVTITSVLATPTAVNSTDVLVQGTAAACNSGRLHVTVDCLGTASGGIAQVFGGNWSLTIASKCVCGSVVTVTATCTDDPACTVTFTGPMPCNCCPQVT